MVRFLISTVPANLAIALAACLRTSTVEAEYGDVVVEGTLRTRAHHGSREANPCPCLADNVSEADRPEVVGGSHVDLDSVGGYLAEIGEKPSAPGFWKLAAFVDINGVHKIQEAGASAEDIRRLNAYWAWSQKAENRVMAPRDGSVMDVTDKAMTAKLVIKLVLADDAELLAAGDAMMEKEIELNQASFRYTAGDGMVIIRESAEFTNHLYRTPEGDLAKAVVAHNRKTGGITVSLADPILGVSACKIVQSVWGDKAGGHEGIAGSPRDRQMTDTDLSLAVVATVCALIDK